MNAKSIAAFSTVLLALTAGPAFALDVGVGASVGASVSSSNSSANASASASASTTSGAESGTTVNANAAASGSASASVGHDDLMFDVIALIDKSAWTETSFEGFVDVDATAHDLGTWVNSDNSAALEAALSANAGDIAELHAALEANVALSAWLDSENTEVSSVVAVGLTANGSLAVFTYDE